MRLVSRKERKRSSRRKRQHDTPLTPERQLQKAANRQYVVIDGLMTVKPTPRKNGFKKTQPTSKYGQYLQSEHWKIFRMNVLIARGTQCAICQCFTKYPNVHHLTYERLGNELPDDVIVTCRGCHEDIHSSNRQL